MKKKSIVTLIVVLLALFAFSGCDPILEAFYPEFTAGGTEGGGENGISVYIEIELPPDGLGEESEPTIGAVLTKPVPAAEPGQPKPKPELVGEAQFVFPDWVWDDYSSTWILTAIFDFYGIGAGDYQVLTWLDLDGDYKPNFDGSEPTAFSEWVEYENDTVIEKGNVFKFAVGDKLWLEGLSLIPFISAGGVFDPVFYLSVGDFTIDKDAPKTEVYTVAQRDPNSTRNIAQLAVWLYAEDWSADYYFYSADGINAGSTTFSINYNSMPDLSGAALPVGNYWLNVQVIYEDNSDFWRTYPVRVLDEYEGSNTIYLNVQIDWLDDDPFFLTADENYPVRAQIIKPDGTIAATEVNNVYLSPSFGTLYVAASTFSTALQIKYNPSNYNSGTGNDFVRITIDVDANSVYNQNDLVLNWPIGVNTTEGANGAYTIYAESWDVVRARPE
jgi:hypothetical protein